MMHHRHWRKTTYQSTSLIAVVLLLLIMFTSAAWFIMFPEGPNPPASPGFEQKLRQNSALWDERRPPSYRYVVQRICACPPEMTTPYIAYEDRGARSAAFLVSVESSTGEFLSEPEDPVYISGIFNELRRAAPNAQRIDARFNSRYGYPESVTIHVGPASATMQYEIRDFEVLEYQ